MHNNQPSRRLDSGLFAALSGTYKTVKNANTYVDPVTQEAASLAAINVLNFWDVRNCIFQACGLSYAYGRPMTVFMVALDGMSELNRRFGAEVANQASTFIMRQLSHYRNVFFGTPNNIVIGQYVPGRFLILLPDISGAAGYHVAEYFRKSITESSFLCSSQAINLSISVGVVHKPGHAGNQDFMILQADQACVEALNMGGNRVTCGRMTEGFQNCA
jgi:diguanylate cyclase (GGDEF)-like protein